MPAIRYRFGEFVLDAQSVRLMRGRTALEVEPKALQTLLYLAAHRDRLVTREELHEQVWRGAFVTEGSQTRAVAQIRKALGDDAREPRYVETAHGLGYRFIAETEEETEGELVAAPGIPAAGTPSRPGVAVLPFLDLSPGGDQQWLCDGLAEEIINLLAQFEGLRVVARTSSFALRGQALDVREIGRRLGAGAVLEGSVQRHDDRLRVTVQLIGAADGCHLWSERFERRAGDLFALEDEISIGVARRLEASLAGSAGESPGRLHVPTAEAHQAHLKGRYFLNRRAPADLERAVRLFDEASALDPLWASPHLGLATAVGVLGLWDLWAAQEAFARGKAAAGKALELAPSLVEGHHLLGGFRFLADWDGPGAREAFDRAGGALPQDAYCRTLLAVFELASGRPEVARRIALRGAEAEPACAIAQTQAGTILAGMGDHAGAAALLEQSLELDERLPMSLLWLGFCRALQGRDEEAEPLLREAAARGLAQAWSALPALAIRRGRLEEGRALVEEFERGTESPGAPRALVERAFAWAAVGERERALALVGEAERKRSPAFTLSLFAPGYLALTPSWLQAWFAHRRSELGPRFRLPAESPAGAPAQG
ncbi:MAG TPA: winged helix-turn-helix domain-containing protein [Thermoanaerobaculia bacterium]|nr:winged helix-turn-helix domain-containing protein [Thermoanaerobaculia bacterium]